MRTQPRPAGSAISPFRRLPIALAVAGALSAPAAMAQAVFDPAQLVVTSVLDDGSPGTLRYAIGYANTWCGTVSSPNITFNIPGTGPFTINASQPMPGFFCGVGTTYTPTIDGYSQPGSAVNTSGNSFNAKLVAVDGALNVYGGCAIGMNQSGTGYALGIKGLDIRNWSSTTAVCGPVVLYGNRITGNYTGVDAYANSVIGALGDANRNVISNNQYGISMDGGFSIVNNLIGADDYGGSLTGAPNNNGINWNCCTQPFGDITGNVIVANNRGVDIEYDNVVRISGNYFNTDGTNLLGSGTYGISLYYSYGASITDNVIAGAGNSAIDSYNGQNVLIKGNKIGTNAAGSAVLGNYQGIYDQYGYGTRIEGNVISGHEDTGIWISGTTNSVITGNAIGTDAGGNAALGNYWGIYIGYVAANNLIDNNLISGNNAGIVSSDASDTTFSNNRIGLSASGTPLPNQYGLEADCGTNLRIDGNTISGNAVDGLTLSGIQNSLVIDNNIGGSGANGGHGIFMAYADCGSVAYGILPKGTKASAAFAPGTYQSDFNRLEGNLIANNGGSGVWITGGNNNTLFQDVINTNLIDGVTIISHTTKDAYGGTVMVSPAVGNSILESPIYANRSKNVNLDYPNTASLLNDAGDGDSNRPNNGQNYAVLSGAVYDPVTNATTISFDLDSRAGNYRIDFFANPMPGAPGGQTYLGNTFMTLAADGSAPGSYAVNGQWMNVSSVTTRAGPESPVVADSSEFSPQVAGTTLAVPGVNVTPTSINFGDVVVGRSSGSSSVTVMSTGTAPYQVRSLREGSCTGPAICTSGSFSCSTTCADGSTWAPGSSCTITASFNPTTLGTQTKVLALCDNTVSSPQTITFTGNGIDAPTVDIAFSPTSWSFGEALVGAQSAPKTFRLVNAGTNTVYLSGATTTTSFSVTGSSCGPSLAGGANCTVDVVFSPVARGGINGALQITASNTAPAVLAAARSKVAAPTTATASVLLQGSGVQFGDLNLPPAIGFGTLILHSDARQQNLELRNTGNGTLALTSITVGGPFTMTNNCGPTLASGASCTVVITFNPATLGSANGSLTIVSDAPGGSRTIALTAQVNADARPVVRITPTSFGFGSRQMGSESAPQALTIVNEGSSPAILTGVVIAQPEPGGVGTSAKPEFNVTGTTCGTTLAPQASCVTNITFKALGVGIRSGEISVSSNSADSPQKATLSGTGCLPYAAANNRSGRDPCK